MVPRIEVDGEYGVLIEWPDGHQSRFAFGDLRDACPCAACRDEQKGRMRLGTAMSRPAESTRLLRISPVGRYAVGLLWGDGHSTGIYSWEFLRERCSCFACRLERREVQG
jgi:DUF971 family protein